MPCKTVNCHIRQLGWAQTSPHTVLPEPVGADTITFRFSTSAVSAPICPHTTSSRTHSLTYTHSRTLPHPRTHTHSHTLPTSFSLWEGRPHLSGNGRLWAAVLHRYALLEPSGVASLMSEVPLKDNARELLAWPDGGDVGAVPSRVMYLCIRLRKSTSHKIVDRRMIEGFARSRSARFRSVTLTVS